MKTSSSEPLEHIGAILPRTLKTCQPEKISTFIGICSIWEEIVEESVAENVRPAAYKHPVLIVHVSSAVWSHHFQFIKKDIIDRINAILKKTAVTDIRCQIS